MDQKVASADNWDNRLSTAALFVTKCAVAVMDVPERILAAIFFAIDVVGYTHLLGVDEPDTLARLVGTSHRCQTNWPETWRLHYLDGWGWFAY